MHEHRVGEPTQVIDPSSGSTTAQAAAQAPPGWYRDPSGGPGSRYWNGATWGETSSDEQWAGPASSVQAHQARPGVQPRPHQPPATPPRQGGFFAWVARRPQAAFWTTLGIALFVGIGIGAASSEQPSDGGSESSQVANLKRDLESAKDDLGATKDRLESTRSELSDTRDDLRAARKKLKKLGAAPAPVATPEQDAPAAGEVQTFSGNGGKNLGTITVAEDSILEWTNDGDIFQIFDAEFGVPVNSQANSGDTALSAGTYRDFQVNAVGNWTITIRPN